MANYSVFNQIEHPLYIQYVNKYISPGINSTPDGGASKDGLLFSVNFSGSVTTSTAVVLQVTNPPGSGKNMYISRVSGSATGTAILFAIIKNATVSGTAISNVNLNFGSATPSVMTAQSSTALITGSPVTVESRIVSAGLFVLDYTGWIILPPNNSLTLSATISTGTSTVTTNINWWEY